MRVVDGDPQHVGQQQEPRDSRHVLELRVERHGYSPAESHAQIHLRHRQESLDEGVADRQEPADHRQQQRRAVQLQRQHQGRQRQHGEQHQGLERGDAPRRQRPIAGARHMRIEAAVGIVVDGAACGAHEHGSNHEDDENSRVGLPRPAIHSAHKVGQSSSQMPIGRSRRMSRA